MSTQKINPNPLDGANFSLQPASPLEDPSTSLSGSSSPVAASDVGVQPVLVVGPQKNYDIAAGGDQVVAPSLDIQDSDGGTLEAANVFVSNNFDSTRDSLGVDGQANGTDNGITWQYNQDTGVLTFTGTASNQDYEDLLKTVTYSNNNTSDPGNARTIEFSLGRPIFYAPNGRYYEFVESQGISWTDAENDANGLDAGGRNYFGLEGYLATITDQGEQAFIQERLAGNGWIGATDVQTPDTWRWVTGPEGLEDGGNGRQFWTGGPIDGDGEGGESGAPVNGQYSNWRRVSEGGGENEPNNLENNEAYAHVIGNDAIDMGASRGKWNDLPDDQDYTGREDFEPQGYIVEYGGFDGETAPQTRGQVAVSFTSGAIDNDFTRDGTPDILWRDYGGSGRNAIWEIEYNPNGNRNTFLRANTDASPFNFSLGADTKFITPATEPGWDIEGTADYDGNGVTDILWRNYDDGRNAIWLMQDGEGGPELQAGYFITEVTEPGWEIEGAKDFDGDGTQEILWRNYDDGRNAIWSLDYDPSNSTAPFSVNTTGRTAFIDSVGTDWEIAGWHDMTGDTIADIVWRNTNTGANAVWGLLSSGGTPTVDATNQYLITSATTDWELEEVYDYNNDGTGDLVWRNYETGDNAIWEMSPGGDIASNGAYLIDVPATPAIGWEMESVADFTGDGIGDVLWRNYTTNDTAIWRMKREGGQIRFDGAYQFDVQTDDPKWEIEAPSPYNDLA